MKRVSLFVFLALLFIFLGVPFLAENNPIARFQAKQAAVAHYRYLAEGNLENAFEYVGYFDEASDLTPNIEFNRAKQIWVERVAKLKEQGTYMSKVKNIKVSVDDTYPVGTAEVELYLDGKKTEITEQIFFGRLKGKWKVQNAEPFSGESTLLHKARSGYVPINDQGLGKSSF